MRAASRLGTSLVLAAGLTASTLVAATPAHAASASFSGGVLTVALSVPDNLRVFEQYDAPGKYLVVSDLGSQPATPAGCATVADYFTCSGVSTVVIHGSSGADDLSIEGAVTAEIHGGAGDDALQAAGLAVSLYGDAGNDTLLAVSGPGTSTVTLEGGDGNDFITGSEIDDTIRGGTGDDSLFGSKGNDTIFGDVGNDKLWGGEGNDTLHGGDGNDTFMGGDGADAFHGGPGADTADYFNQYGAASVAFSASLDGVANDGAAGEGDNVNADGSVENLNSGDLNYPDSVTLIGDDGPNILKGYSPKAMNADGRGGDDVIEVRSMVNGSGHTVVQGGAGNDSINSDGATSTVDGGPGNDVIHSGKGHDTVSGGPGQDTIDTGFGNDTVNSRDGEVDSVSCGVGADSVVGDKIDVINGDPLALCESQDLAGGTKPDTGGPEGPGVTAGTFNVSMPKKVKVSRKGVVSFKVANGFGNTVKLKVVVKSKKPKMKLGTATAKVRAMAKGKVKVKLTKRAMKLLKRKKRLKVTVTFKATKGAKGTIKGRTTLRR